MTLNELLPDLLKLSRDEKLQAIEILKRDVISTNNSEITPGTGYEVWSPFDSAATAFELLQMLNSKK
jgi:hypothetical protein